MSNEELIKYLSQIKGVGQWTVEMILMFTLGREDIFAVDDLCIQQAVCKLYKIDAEDKKAMKEKMLSVSKNGVRIEPMLVAISGVGRIMCRLRHKVIPLSLSKTQRAQRTL